MNIALYILLFFVSIPVFVVLSLVAMILVLEYISMIKTFKKLLSEKDKNQNEHK